MPPPKMTLPDYHNGFIAGLLDAKGLMDKLSQNPMPMNGLEEKSMIKLGDARDVFKSILANISLGIEHKAEEARRHAEMIMTSPKNGGVA